MKEQDISKKRMKGFKRKDYFEFRDSEYVFIVAKFESFNFASKYYNEDFRYFLYIFKQKHKNVLCFRHLYQNYDELAKNALPVIKEYILDTEVLFDFIQKIMELDPELIN